jgi:hypothetical protein
VGAAAQSQIRDAAFAASCDRHGVIEFEIVFAFTAPAGIAQERATPLIALPDFAPHVSWNVARIR